MSKLRQMAAWVQSFLDAQDVGEVMVAAPDHTPGTCFLQTMGGKGLEQVEDVHGNLTIERSSCFQITYFSLQPTSPWLEQLESWLIRSCLQGDAPEFCRQNPRVWLEDQKARQALEDLWLHTARIWVRYTTFYEKEVTG